MSAHGARYCPRCHAGNAAETPDGRNQCRSCFAVWRPDEAFSDPYMDSCSDPDSDGGGR